MKRICKQCGAEFTLTQDEISFYQSKDLHIPKRCEKCRMENRAGGKAGAGMRPVSSGKELTGNDYESVMTSGQVVRAYDAGRNGNKKVWIVVAAVFLLLAVGIVGFRLKSLPEQNGNVADVQPAPAAAYNFRRPENLQDHFNKHGAEFGYASAEEYLAGANRVAASPEALHKLEAEDGDDVYYLESTNEFVIVSTDGYLRTYFKPNDGKAYFDRQ